MNHYLYLYAAEGCRKRDAMDYTSWTMMIPACEKAKHWRVKTSTTVVRFKDIGWDTTYPRRCQECEGYLNLQALRDGEKCPNCGGIGMEDHWTPCMTCRARDEAEHE